jgi:2-desacetyl-2-hydroxyethyl bacteriochlorophyllide A dehydrogenase
VRAVVARGPHDFRLEQVDEPAANAGALVRVEAAGVCAADRYIYAGTSPWDISFPFIPGHEWVGVIEEIAPEAAGRWNLDVGDRVTAEVMVPCGLCRLCRAGRTNLCRQGCHIGSDLPGGWAEFLSLPLGARVWTVPDDILPHRAVFAEPLSCALHAVARAELQDGETIAIAGMGPIGAAAVGATKILHRVRVIALGTSSDRCRLAIEMGADEVIDIRAEEVHERLDGLTNGRGVDAYVELSGSNGSVETALDCVSAGGRVVLYGVYNGPATVDWNQVAEFKELKIIGGHLSPGAWGTALELIRTDAVNVDRLVTHRLPLARFEEALGSDRTTRIKTVLEVSEPMAGHQKPEEHA